MNLKDLMVDTKAAWIDYPGLDGFQVHVVNLGRERLVTLRKGCIKSTFDRRTKQLREELDEKKFIREFTNETVKGWKGLKLAYLEELLLVDISAQDPEVELPYSEENAEMLVTQSGDFDTWLNEVVFDLENFRTGGTRKNMEKTGEVAE